MAFITMDMLQKVAAENQVFLLGIENYDSIKQIVMDNKARAKQVFALANEEWAASQLEKLLVDGTLFVPKPAEKLASYIGKTVALKRVIKAAQLSQFFWTETERGFSINRR